MDLDEALSNVERNDKNLPFLKRCSRKKCGKWLNKPSEVISKSKEKYIVSDGFCPPCRKHEEKVQFKGYRDAEKKKKGGGGIAAAIIIFIILAILL